MAAKQGTLAQLSAKAEDTKRAVLHKAGASSWFSNLNTVCTIKSAPPRSPDVLALLATKSGWLYKRNEQHVWQARWCCVVPHMFLYYFDATSHGNNSNQQSSMIMPNPNSNQQEEWNASVREGLGNRKPHERRSHFGLFNNTSNTTHNNTMPHTHNTASSTTTPLLEDEPAVGVGQPAGIIDLECYTHIHRSCTNPSVLELAGDDQVNPDLRSFYFCAPPDSVEEWNTALLGHRHAALSDEVDAYKQVADGFAQQLQVLHAELDVAKSRHEQGEQELYRVRSAAEEQRRAVYRIVQEATDQAITPSTTQLDATERRLEFRATLETVRQQDLGVTATVQMLMEYWAASEGYLLALSQTLIKMQVQQSGHADQAELQELQKAHGQQQSEFAREKQDLVNQLAVLQASHQAATKELQDVQKDLSSTKIQVTMLMSQQRNKLATQQQHKKILKKEVVELRQKLEDAASENSSLKHENEKMKLQLTQEQAKANLLARYVDKMESQVQVQQNMMEMMSQAGSVYAGGNMSVVAHSVASRNDNDFTPHRRNRNTIADEDEEGVDGQQQQQQRIRPDTTATTASPSPGSPPKSHHRRRWNRNTVDNDMDNKSHMSELTEDRTQREFVALQQQQHVVYAPYPDSARTKHLKQPSPDQKVYGPPTVIIGVKKNDALEKRDSMDDDDEDGHDEVEVSRKEYGRRQLDTIGGGGIPPSSSASAPPRPRNNTIPRSGSVSSSEQTLEAGKKLSVAQRARMEADRMTTPVRARIDETSRNWLTSDKSKSPEKDSPSVTSSRQSSLWKRLVGSEGGDDASQTDSEKKDAAARLSLQQRCQLQREKQLRFLQHQGLVHDESDLPGGAGGADVSVTSSSTSSQLLQLSPTRSNGRV